MVEAPLGIAPGMAFEAGKINIGIASDPRMFAVHVRLVVAVTADTCKGSIVCGVRMAVGAGIPGPSMLARIYGEKLVVMLPVFSRFPTRVGSMAFCTNDIEVGCDMVRVVCGVLVIFAVAIVTFHSKGFKAKE
jgi:hypothetical protein